MWPVRADPVAASPGRSRCGPSGPLCARSVRAGRVINRMYAVVRTGGKQYRVEQGQRLRVERVGDPGSTVELTPLLVVHP